jgi:hypothetical protein
LIVQNDFWKHIFSRDSELGFFNQVFQPDLSKVSEGGAKYIGIGNKAQSADQQKLGRVGLSLLT